MLDRSRGVSESSMLTTECSRCVAEDAEGGLEFYGVQYGVRGNPDGVEKDADETGWRDVVRRVRDSWADVKERQQEGRRVSPPRPHPPSPPPPIETAVARTTSPPSRSVDGGSLGVWEQQSPQRRRQHHQPQPQQQYGDAAALQRRVAVLQQTIESLQNDKLRLEAERSSLTTENTKYRQAVAAKDARLAKLRNVRTQLNLLSNLNKRGADIHAKRQQALSGLEHEVKLLFSEWQESRMRFAIEAPHRRLPAAPRTASTRRRKPRPVWTT